MVMSRITCNRLLVTAAVLAMLGFQLQASSMALGQPYAWAYSMGDYKGPNAGDSVVICMEITSMGLMTLAVLLLGTITIVAHEQLASNPWAVTFALVLCASSGVFLLVGLVVRALKDTVFESYTMTTSVTAVLSQLSATAMLAATLAGYGKESVSDGYAPDED